MKVLVIDNFDSFTYNLVQRLGKLGARICVYRNDEISPEKVLEISPDRVLISPGPGTPDDAGISRDVIKATAGKIPLLGVCLGHQCIAEVFGASIVRTKPMHGKTSIVEHDGKGVFTGLDRPVEVARYHSLAADMKTIDGAEFDVSARTKDGVVMGIRHKKYEIEGIQFHPESFMTPDGDKMLLNFLQKAR